MQRSSYYVTDESGLPDSYINYVLEDRDGNIWIGTNYGFSVIYHTIPVFYQPTKKLDIKTIPRDLKTYQGNQIVVATLNGLYRYKKVYI